MGEFLTLYDDFGRDVPEAVIDVVGEAPCDPPLYKPIAAFTVS
jgi:hypothetical protein